MENLDTTILFAEPYPQGKVLSIMLVMECSSPAQASHGWRGILAGREILRNGLGWVVGDGSRINLWSDAWLSTTYPLSPMGPSDQVSVDLKVGDLIDPISKDWNVDAIRQLLPQYEAHIRQLVPSVLGSPDTQAWLPTKSGAYSSKSGYFLAMEASSSNSSSQDLENFNWMPNVWNLYTSPKIKIFFWRALSQALPVGAILASRHITSAVKCLRCGGEEDGSHVLFFCPFAQAI